VTPGSDLPTVSDAYRINLEGGFDAALVYVFSGPGFEKLHRVEEPSLVLMGRGIGESQWHVPDSKPGEQY
jgi:hypothetical protein